MDPMGKWRCKISTPMGNYECVFDFKRTATGFEGRGSADFGAMDILDGKVDGNRLTWKMAIRRPVTIQLQFDVIAEGDQIKGTAKPPLLPGMPVTGNRVS